MHIEPRTSRVSDVCLLARQRAQVAREQILRGKKIEKCQQPRRSAIQEVARVSSRTSSVARSRSLVGSSSDLTASRAALVLCGDIVAAARVLAIEPSGQSPLSVQERLTDLLSFFVSEDHFAVRAALGMQVNLTPPSSPTGTPAKRRMSHVQTKAE